MRSLTTHFTAATAALVLSLVTINAVVSVPAANAAVHGVTVELA